MKAKRKGLKGKQIIVGVTGSIAAYKAAEIVSYLTQAAAKVKVIMTPAATFFISSLTFQTLSHNPVATNLFESVEKPARRSGGYDPEHISLARWADLMLIVPATANIIGKIAAGLADDLLSAVIMSVKTPVLIAPAMNENMYKNPIVQENIKRLEKLGYKFIAPAKGRLACQEIGEGRLASFARIIDAVKSFL